MRGQYLLQGRGDGAGVVRHLDGDLRTQAEAGLYGARWACGDAGGDLLKTGVGHIALAIAGGGGIMPGRARQPHDAQVRRAL